MVRAARAYVPVIIRRPHAYDFLMERYSERAGGEAEVRGGEAGLQVGELDLPIPGFYVLSGDEKVIGQCGLASVDEVLTFLATHTKP